MLSVYIRIIFVLWFFLLSWLIVIPYSHSDEISVLHEKTKTVQQMVRQIRDSGKSLTPEMAEELQKARKARKEKDWLVLEKSLDRIIEICSTNSDRKPWDLTPQEREILAAADERIEKYRMATAKLTIVTSDGQPLANAVVKIDQTKHEFLFGVNNSRIMWFSYLDKKYGSHSLNPNIYNRLKRYYVTEYQIENYMQRLIKLANYTSLPVCWRLYEFEKGDIPYSIYDKEIERFHKNGLKVLAHNLVWNNYTPSWIPDDCDAIAMAVKKRVKDFIDHYKGKFDYFVVFNEAANPFRPIFKKVKMTKCFREIGKIPFTSMPFTICREVDPSAKLMINEVDIRTDHKFPDLLKHLKDAKGKPLFDIIGIQSHMHRRIWPLDYVWKLCEFYSAFNVPLHFTELTVLSGTPISGNYGMETTPDGERKQAEYVVMLYSVLFSHPSVEAIQWWDFTDLKSWKGAPAGLLRKDMSPKPIYEDLMHLIKTKWWTNMEATTSKLGECEFKGFWGDYSITVVAPNGQNKTFDITMTRKGKRNYRLTF